MKKKMITLAMVLFTFLSCSNKDYFDEGASIFMNNTKTIPFQI